MPLQATSKGSLYTGLQTCKVQPQQPLNDEAPARTDSKLR